MWKSGNVVFKTVVKFHGVNNALAFQLRRPKPHNPQSIHFSLALKPPEFFFVGRIEELFAETANMMHPFVLHFLVNQASTVLTLTDSVCSRLITKGRNSAALETMCTGPPLPVASLADSLFHAKRLASITEYVFRPQ